MNNKEAISLLKYYKGKINIDEALALAIKALEGIPQEDIIKELWNCRNELCLKCERYKEAWNGACKDCRYNFENMEKWKGKQE